jgi:hypothetical protein
MLVLVSECRSKEEQINRAPLYHYPHLPSPAPSSFGYKPFLCIAIAVLKVVKVLLEAGAGRSFQVFAPALNKEKQVIATIAGNLFLV